MVKMLLRMFIVILSFLNLSLVWVWNFLNFFLFKYVECVFKLESKSLIVLVMILEMLILFIYFFLIFEIILEKWLNVFIFLVVNFCGFFLIGLIGFFFLILLLCKFIVREIVNNFLKSCFVIVNNIIYFWD